MGLIIDTNAVAMVFNSENSRHKEFKPVLDCLINRKTKSKLVYGGNKYLEEVNNFKAHLKLLVLLNQLGKTIKLDDTKVNNKQDEIEKELIKKGFDPINDDKYNDCHILAMAILSKTKVIVSNDMKSKPLICDKKYYSRSKHIPVFYTSLRNNRILKNPIYFSNCI
jgi:predicted nucleic acid-binding protein